MSAPVIQDNDLCSWVLDLNGNGHDSDFSLYDTTTTRVRLYAEDDAYFSMDFVSRQQLEGFIARLRQAADEVWPP